jgi:hypothetical protein
MRQQPGDNSLRDPERRPVLASQEFCAELTSNLGDSASQENKCPRKQRLPSGAPLISDYDKRELVGDLASVAGESKTGFLRL